MRMSDFPGKILLGTDGSEDAALAARVAIGLAKDTDAELQVVHVAETHYTYLPRTGGPLPSTQTDEEIKQEHQALLDYEVEQIKQAGGNVVKSHLRVGKPAEEILRVSEEIIAGLIIVGNQGLGRKFGRLKRFLMGSVSERVTTYARCSVMVVRRDLYDRHPT
jgi:nucleotide-binding universal stress UspA family protein